MRWRPRIVILAVLSISWPLFDAAAQSVSVSQSTNGTVLALSTSLGPGLPVEARVNTMYSIVGVLDVGLALGFSHDPADASARSRIGLAYASTPLKQALGFPVSAHVYGDYTFVSERSDFLERNRLERQARGYTVGLQIVRDLSVSDVVSLRLGALGEYENLVEETAATFNTAGFAGTSEVDYAEYPEVRRVDRAAGGGYAGILFGWDSQDALLVGCAVVVDQELGFEVRPDIQVFLSRE